MSRLQRTRATRVCASLLLQFTVLALIWTTSTRITPPPPQSTTARTVDGFLVGTNPTKILPTTRSSSSPSSCPSSKRIALDLSVKKPAAPKINEDEDHHHHHHDHHHHHHHYDHHHHGIKKRMHVAKFKTFDEVLDRHHDETVLVCFEAFNCGPCRLMKKELEQLQTLLKQEDEKTTKQMMTMMTMKKKNKGRDKIEEEKEEERVAATPSSPLSSSPTPTSTPPLKIFRLDTERYPYLGVRYEIHRLPCLVFVKNHKVQLKLEGLTTADNIYQGFKSLRP